MTSDHGSSARSGPCELGCSGCEACTVDPTVFQNADKPNRGRAMLAVLFASRAALESEATRVTAPLNAKDGHPWQEVNVELNNIMEE